MQTDPAILTIIQQHHLMLAPDAITQVVHLLRAQQKMLAVAWLQKGTSVSLPEALEIIEAIDQVLKTS